MVQSNYTVSTAHQLLGRLPTVRVSGSKAKSRSASETAHVTAVGQPNRAPAPTRPLPPTPLNTVRVRSSRSSDVLPTADKIKIKTDIPAVVSEDKVLTLPATVYTPNTPRAKSEGVTLALKTDQTASGRPVLETSRKGRKSAVIDKRISQYYEYITPPVSLDLGRTGSRRERKASHTPTSSTGSDIYFSPIDATHSQVFLSSPQPSPPISPSDAPEQERLVASYEDGLVEKAASLAIQSSTDNRPEMVASADIDAHVNDGKMTLTLAHVDRITLALAQAPLVQMRVRGSHLDTSPEAVTSKPFDHAEDKNTTAPMDLPTPPPSEASVSDEIGGIALINTNIEGTPVSLASTDAFRTGKCTHLSMPYGVSTTSRLRIEPALISNAESKIILQSLFVTLDRKTNARDLTLLAETDVTPSFARAALTELAEAHKLTLDDLEIRTPIAPYSPEESIDWCNLDSEDVPAPEVTSPVANILDDIISSFASTLSAETCTMQTLTLLSELARLQTAHRTFLILQPTRFDAKGGLAAVKIPLISTALRQRFEAMGNSSASGSSSSSNGSEPATPKPSMNGGSKGRQFREAVIAAVGPRFVLGEEFETFVVLEGGEIRVRARCVPLAAGEVIERWVCFLGGEYDVPY